MQNIIVEKPYKFIAPHRGNWWPSFIQRFRLIDRWLRSSEGVISHECRNGHLLRQSLDAGHGIMLAPNHARPGDPIAMGFLAREVKTHVYAMASWHLFHQGRFNAFAIHKMGGFSLNREGIDRLAINTGIEILQTAERPLILFPEGAVSRTNERLMALLDGVAFIARTAAKKREKDNGGKVVVHPVALKYQFRGDLRATIEPVLSMIEHRFSWRPQTKLPLLERVFKVGRSLLSLKEIEYFGEVQSGRRLHDRLEHLIDRLLGPLEQQWLAGAKSGPIVPRVKALRMQIMPDMVRGGLSAIERAQRWEQLADIYLAQQVYSYPADYLTTRPSADRILETVERYEEDLTDQVTVHGNLHCVIEVGEAIEVSPTRDRKAEVDPLMAQIESELQAMLDKLALETPVWEGP
jgi:1-acyl-sn-glycerol-3-phosphate acyltransferase